MLKLKNFKVKFFEQLPVIKLSLTANNNIQSCKYTYLKTRCILTGRRRSSLSEGKSERGQRTCLLEAITEKGQPADRVLAFLLLLLVLKKKFFFSYFIIFILSGLSLLLTFATIFLSRAFNFTALNKCGGYCLCAHRKVVSLDEKCVNIHDEGRDDLPLKQLMSSS